MQLEDAEVRTDAAAPIVKIRLSSTRWVVLSAWVSRLISAAVAIYSLRILSNRLDPLEYASFIIIVALASWYALADLGLGYATQNAVTQKASLGDSAAGSVLMAYMLLAASTVLISLLAFAFSHRIGAVLFARVHGTQATDYATAIWWSAVIFTMTATAGAANKLLYAVHQGYVANICAAVGSIAGLVILATGLPHADDKIIFAVAAMYGPNVVISLVLALRQIRQSLVARPPLRRADLIALLRSARGFLLFALMAAAVLQLDYLIMSQKVAPLDIIQYYNLAKLFGFIAFFNQAVMFASWPKFTEQFAQGQFDQVSRSIQRLIVQGAMVALISTAAMLALSGRLGAVVSPGTPIEYRHTLIAGFGALALVRCLTDPFAIFLQSIGRLRPLIVFAALQAVIGGALQWLMADAFGAEGVMIAIVLSFLVTVAWGLPASARRQLKGATAN